MAKTGSLTRYLVPVGWVCQVVMLTLAVLAAFYPTVVNLGAGQFTGTPEYSSGGGLTTGFVESQVMVFWLAEGLVTLLAAFGFAGVVYYAGLINARSIAAGRGRKWLPGVFLAVALLALTVVVLVYLPGAIFDPVDATRLKSVSLIASFAQRSYLGSALVGIGVTILAMLGAWVGVQLIWARWVRSRQRERFSQILGKARA